RRGHNDLRHGYSDRSFDLSRTVPRARRYSARDRERGVGRGERATSRVRPVGKGGTRGTTKMTEARTDPDLLYVGTYTESIYLLRMDRGSGALLQVGAATA